MLDFWKKEEPKQVEDDDPVTKLMKQTGCLDLHHEVQVIYECQICLHPSLVCQRAHKLDEFLLGGD